MDHKPLEGYKLKLKDLELESKGLFKISCPSCENFISAENLNINDKIAKCKHCDGVFSFQDRIGDLLSIQKVKQKIIRPEGIDMFYFKDELDFTFQQPYSIWGLAYILLAIPLAILLTVLAFKQQELIWASLAAFFWLSSIQPIYKLIRLSKDKIHINIDEHQISVKWRPNNMVKDQSFDIKDIDQIYMKINPNTARYDLYMVINSPDGQKHQRLLAGVTSKTKARFLEQEIERHLGIIDREVIEETK